MPTRGDHIVFLLGSGISLPAGMPSTGCITQRVLSGKGVLCCSDGRYCFADIPDPGGMFGYRKRVEAVLCLLKVLKRSIDAYYQSWQGRSTNYEDLYYAAFQIMANATRRLDNPALQPFIEGVQKQVQGELPDGMGLAELARQTCDYIKDVVTHLLSGKPSRLDHLRCITQACLDESSARVDLFTLNHDEVLEGVLCDAGINATDGFRKLNDGVCVWDPSLFEEETGRARLFKLHGSVNWFPTWDRSVAKPPAGALDRDGYVHCGRKVFTKQRPELLVGTFNKVLDYPNSVYMDLHYWFYRSLRGSRLLVISGYGFGDLGINRRILEWAPTDRRNRLAIIHKDPEELRDMSRSEVSESWNDLEGNSMLVLIRKWIQCVTWGDVAAALRSSAC